MNSLVKNTTKIFGGSAVAAIGFSFGKDIYRKGKANSEKLLLLAIIVLSLLGTYVGGLFLARNYKSLSGSFFSRVLGLIILVPSAAVTSIALILAASISTLVHPWEFTIDSKYIEVKPSPSDATVGEVFMIGYDDDRVVFGTASTFVGTTGAVGLFGLGLLVGITDREKRKKMWRIEKENEKFLVTNKLSENDNKKLLDGNVDQIFRVEGIDSIRITLFPEGRRGKRAYIKLDEDGKYLEYTGIVKMG